MSLGSPKLPKPPAPQGEYYYQNGQLTSQRTYDPSLNAYVSQNFLSPNDSRILNRSRAGIANLLGQVGNAVNLSPAALNQYGDAFAAPQINALNLAYNQAKGNLEGAAGAAGMRNSVGMNTYLANVLEKNRAQGLADIQANKMQQEYNLPNEILSPYINEFNLYNSALSGQNATMAQNLEPAFQGSQAAQNAINQNYANQLNYYQMKRQSGLFGFLTGV